VKMRKCQGPHAE